MSNNNTHNGNRQIANGTIAFEANSRINENQQPSYLSFTLPQNTESKVMSAPHISAQARGGPGSNQMPAPFYPSQRNANLMNQRPTLEAVSIVQHNPSLPHTVPEYTVVVNSQFPPSHSTSVGPNQPFNPNPMQTRSDNLYQPSFVPAGAPFIYPQLINPYYSQPASQWVGPASATPLGGQYIPTMPYSQMLPPNAIRVPTSNMASVPVVQASQAGPGGSHIPPMYGGGAAPAQQQAPKRERHVLAIIDPQTNKNILEGETNAGAGATPSPAATDQPPFNKPPSYYGHDQHGHGHALPSTLSRQATTPPNQGAAPAGGRTAKDTTSGNDRPRPSHSPATAAQSQENVAQMENAYSELSLAIAQVTDKKDDQKVAAAHSKPLPHAENAPPAAAIAVKRVDKVPPPQQVAPAAAAAAAPPITFGFFDDSGVGAGSDEISSPSPPEVSPEKTTQLETATVAAGSGAQAAVAVELANNTLITGGARSAVIQAAEETTSTTILATVEKKDTVIVEKLEIAKIQKIVVEKKDPQVELLGELKNKKAPDAWFYDNLEGNRVYASDYMLLLLKLPLSCQKPHFSTHLPDVIMPDWENRAEQSVQRRTAGVIPVNVPHQFSGRSSMTGGGAGAGMMNFQAPWQKPSATIDMSRRIGGYGGRGSQGGAGGGGGASIGGRGSQDGRDRRAGPRSSQQGQQPPMIIPRPSLNAEVQLNRTENAWKPIRHQNAGADPEIVKTKELFRDVKALLNKITPQTFDDLSKDFYDLWTKVDTVDRADGVIEILFRKVCDEPTFAELYARLCSGLRSHQVSNPPAQDCGINTFNFQLLMKCQKDFEKEKSTEDYREELMQEIANTQSETEKKILGDNLEEKINKYKWRLLGSIRFVGELYKFGLLTQYLAHICVHRLINKAQQFDEEVTQCLCQLLTNIGAKLENEKPDAKNRVSGDYVKKYFEVLKSLQKDSRFCKRIQFEILNLIELREVYHWEPRRQKEGPKKLEEVHADIEREKMAKSTELENMGPPQPPSRKGSQYQTYGQQPKGGQEYFGQGQQQRRDFYQSGRSSHHGSYASNLYAQGEDDGPTMQGGTLNRRKPSQPMGGGGRPSQGGRGSISNRGGQGPQSQQQSAQQSSSQGQDRALKSEAFKTNTEMLKPQSKSWSSKANQQQANVQTSLQNRFAVFDDQSKTAGGARSSGGAVNAAKDSSAPGSRESSRAPSDRLAALEAVSSLSRQSSSGGGARFETPAATAGGASTTSSSREPSVVRDAGAAVSTAAADAMPSEKLKRYAIDLFAEYASSGEYSEAKELILERKSRFAEMVPYILEHIVEKKDEDRLKFAGLMSKLYNDSVIDKQMLADGFAKFVELCIENDLVGDVPLLWDYLATIITEILTSSSSSRSLRLGDFYSSFQAADHHKYKLFTKCLQKLSHLPVDKQKSTYGDFFTSGANYWSIFDFADLSALIDDLKDKGISLPEFPPSAAPPSQSPSGNNSNSIVNSSNNELIAKALQDTVLLEMERLIKSMNPVDGDILIQYIVKNVKGETLSEEYAHALARYLCSNVFKMMHSDGESREIEELFGPCLPVFTRFFTGNKPLEKILLTTLSEVYYENECPKDSLTTIFELLSMENTLPRDAFLDWWSLEQQRNTYGMILRNSKLKTFVETLQRSEDCGAGQTSAVAAVAETTSDGAWTTPKSQSSSTKTKKK